jgi:hypothetical protein
VKSAPSRRGTIAYPEGSVPEGVFVPTVHHPRIILTTGSEDVNADNAKLALGGDLIALPGHGLVYCVK